MDFHKDFSSKEPKNLFPKDLRSICFRVTRYCNLHCEFCQVPPDGSYLSIKQIAKTLKWLKKEKINSVKLTGGEPLIRNDINEILRLCYVLDIKPTLCTNGTLFEKSHIANISFVNSKVKISLHSYIPEEHNQIVGGKSDIFSIVLKNIKLLNESNIHVSLHTLLSKRYPINIEKMINFAISLVVKKISFISFVPRGRGKQLEQEYSFTKKERIKLEGLIEFYSKKYRSEIEVHYLNFWDKEYYSIEPAYGLVIERERESNDSFLEPLFEKQFKDNSE